MVRSDSVGKLRKGVVTMKEGLRNFLLLAMMFLLMILFVVALSSMSWLSETLEYTLSGTSAKNTCESQGGRYVELTFEPKKCYIGNEIYEIYHQDGEYKLAK